MGADGSKPEDAKPKQYAFNSSTPKAVPVGTAVDFGDGKKHEIQFKGGKVFSVDIAIARQDEKKALEQSTYQPDARLLAALEVAK